MEILCKKRLFCAIEYVQNNFFIEFLEKCHIFAFLAAYQLRGHLFFCSKMSLFQFFNRGYIWEFFWIFGPFGAFSLPTNWGDKYFLRIMAFLGRFRCLLLRGANTKNINFLEQCLYFWHPRRLLLEGIFSFYTYLLA